MRSDDVQAFPLAWPTGYSRSSPRLNRHPFKPGLTFDRARISLRDELGRLGATHITLSTNIPLRQDGEPYADAARRRVEDPGVAIYFTLKGKQLVMAQDRFWDIAGNIRSLAMAIEGMRALERHGGGVMMEKAFDGFLALPAPDGPVVKRPWWIVLNYGDDPEARADLTIDEVTARFRALAKKRHPETDGGSTEAMAELTDARDRAVKDLGG